MCFECTYTAIYYVYVCTQVQCIIIIATFTLCDISYYQACQIPLFPFFLVSSPSTHFQRRKPKHPQLRTLIDLHRDFGQAMHWLAATHVPPAYNLKLNIMLIFIDVHVWIYEHVQIYVVSCCWIYYETSCFLDVLCIMSALISSCCDINTCFTKNLRCRFVPSMIRELTFSLFVM